MSDDMIEGYRDGRDADSPKPSSNRSAAYRHGFACGRSDRDGKPAFGSAAEARSRAEKALRADASTRGER